MKKQRLKGWVKVILTIIAMLSFCFMASDCDDILIFLSSHIIATTTFILSVGILEKYNR